VKKISDNAYVMNLPSIMSMSKIFNVVDFYEYHPTEKIYPKSNRRSSQKMKADQDRAADRLN